MDNKKKLVDAFLGLNNHATSIMDILKTGDGLGLTEEQKLEFEKAKSDNKADETIKDLEEKLQQFRNKMTGI